MDFGRRHLETLPAPPPPGEAAEVAHHRSSSPTLHLPSCGLPRSLLQFAMAATSRDAPSSTRSAINTACYSPACITILQLEYRLPLLPVLRSQVTAIISSSSSPAIASPHPELPRSGRPFARNHRDLMSLLTGSSHSLPATVTIAPSTASPLHQSHCPCLPWSHPHHYPMLVAISPPPSTTSLAISPPPKPIPIIVLCRSQEPLCFNPLSPN